VARAQTRHVSSQHAWESSHGQEQSPGSIKEIKGAGKEAIGKAIGDAKLQSDGKSDQTEGKIRNAVGGVTDAVREALKK
jgi:uncharacterized protein YjbJ (UPF0337 family)